MEGMAVKARKEIGDILRFDAFSIDAIACKSAAEAIASYTAGVERAPWGNLPREIQLGFKLAFVGICHQFNWDFLQGRLASILLEDGAAELVERIARASARDVQEWLSDYEKPERIEAAERARLLRDIGRKTITKLSGQPWSLVETAGYMIGGEKGFLEQLDIFDAFSADPLRKKSNILVQELIREGIVSFKDEEVVGPAVDYHIIRLYLRTGRVLPKHDELGVYLGRHPRPRERLVELLRSAVAEALRLTAFYANLSVPVVNYIEWQIGRGVCFNDRPGCLDCNVAEDFDPEIRSLCNGPCVYAFFCKAFGSETWRELEEPRFRSTFY